MTLEMEDSNKEQDVEWCRQPVRLEIIGKLVTAILHQPLKKLRGV